ARMRNRRQRGRRKRRNQWQPALGLVAVAYLCALSLGCGKTASIPEIHDSIPPLVRAGRYHEALKHIETGLRLSSKRGDLSSYWGFYLTKAEVVAQTEGAPPALKLLEAARIPEGPAFEALHARQQLDQAKANYRMSHYEAAKTLLAAGERLADTAQNA